MPRTQAPLSVAVLWAVLSAHMVAGDICACDKSDASCPSTGVVRNSNPDRVTAFYSCVNTWVPCWCRAPASGGSSTDVTLRERSVTGTSTPYPSGVWVEVPPRGAACFAWRPEDVDPSGVAEVTVDARMWRTTAPTGSVGTVETIYEGGGGSGAVVGVCLHRPCGDDYVAEPGANPAEEARATVDVGVSPPQAERLTFSMATLVLPTGASGHPACACAGRTCAGGLNGSDYLRAAGLLGADLAEDACEEAPGGSGACVARANVVPSTRVETTAAEGQGNETSGVGVGSSTTAREESAFPESSGEAPSSGACWNSRSLPVTAIWGSGAAVAWLL